MRSVVLSPLAPSLRALGDAIHLAVAGLLRASPRNDKRGFTLIELAIVLVIIGLIVGGILMGRDLIRSAQIRSVINELHEFDTALNTFRLKYNCMAGDCSTATSFFGVDSAGCGVGGGATGTCNGNGNGFWGNTSTENYHAWKQLALAGLIAGSYTGVSGTGGCGNGCVSINGVNVPASKMPLGGYTAWLRSTAFPTLYFNVYQTNEILFGAAAVNSYNNANIMTGLEVQNIDVKIDDGAVISGRVSVWKNKGTSCVSSTSDTAATYVTTSSVIACNLTYVVR